MEKKKLSFIKIDKPMKKKKKNSDEIQTIKFKRLLGKD